MPCAVFPFLKIKSNHEALAILDDIFRPRRNLSGHREPLTAYYNEIDPYAAQWLRNLIQAGLIASGEVDTRSIVDVRPAELRGFTQCHFFAGIGGWPYALRLAGFPDDRAVWTGSCPCQPFSHAGQRKGAADERHLWPEWFRLIGELSPPIIFGEQVARAIGYAWLDAVAHDLETEGYAVGAAVLPACSVGSPHQRDRLWFVADTRCSELRDQPGRLGREGGTCAPVARDHGSARAMAHANGDERHGRSSLLQMGWSGSASEAQDNAASRGIEWPAEPDVPRVAHGVSNRLVKLRGLGNAIVPQVAAAFIQATM